MAKLLNGDTTQLPITPGAPPWGLYKNGAMVIQADNVVQVDYDQNWTVSDYPVEQGGFESYDKVTLPFDGRFRFSRGGDAPTRKALLDSIAAIAGTTQLFDLVIPEETYPNVNIIRQNYNRKADAGLGLMIVDVWVQEIRIAPDASFTTTGGTQPITNSKTPQGQSAVDGGQVNGTPPNSIQLTIPNGFNGNDELNNFGGW